MRKLEFFEELVHAEVSLEKSYDTSLVDCIIFPHLMQTAIGKAFRVLVSFEIMQLTFLSKKRKDMLPMLVTAFCGIVATRSADKLFFFTGSKDFFGSFLLEQGLPR